VEMQPQIKEQYKGKVISQNPTKTHIQIHWTNQPTNYTLFFLPSFSPTKSRSQNLLYIHTTISIPKDI